MISKNYPSPETAFLAVDPCEEYKSPIPHEGLLLVGTDGNASKVILLTEESFQPLMAPHDAVIERFTRYGKNYVKLSYRCGTAGGAK